MFIGEYQHTLDEKGRIALPTKFRAAFKDGAIITRGLDESLFIYSKSQWELLAERLAALPIAQAHNRAFARFMLAGAMDVDIDAQGRITVPEYLRTFAKLKKKVIVTGLFNRLEVWDENAWRIYNSKNEKQSTKIAESIVDLGI
jgi:MraZ protein